MEPFPTTTIHEFKAAVQVEMDPCMFIRHIEITPCAMTYD